MKIRLEVTTPGGQSSVFDSKGPVVRIGRDPVCELLLEADAGTAASRMHARIDLTTGTARLIDLGSANKTLHNDRIITSEVILQVGDRIQIGHTGSTLAVRELDFTAPPPATGLPLNKLALGVGALVLCLATMSAVYVLNRSREKLPDNSLSAEKQEKSGSGEGTPQKDKKDPPITKDETGKSGEGNKPTEQPDTTSKDKGNTSVKTVSPPPSDPPVVPRLEVQEVGHYIRRPEVRPSVLVQRSGEDKPWTVLRSGEPVSSTHVLVSLPGYESLIILKTGLRLNLWGNLPLFSPAEVRESIVVLDVPRPQFEADLVLDRGRVEFTRTDKANQARIRLRFHGEVWDINLAEPASKACVELSNEFTVGAPSGPVARLYTRGKVEVKAAGKHQELTDNAQLTWRSWEPKVVHTDKLNEPPPWWDKAPKGTEAIAETLLSLQDWAEKPQRLSGSTDEVVKSILAVIRDGSNERSDRMLGLLFLAALDEVAALARFLEDESRNDAGIRGTAQMGLQDWLVRNPTREAYLAKQIEGLGHPRKTVALIVQLLQPFSLSATKDPSTYELLIGYLDHDNLAVRHLAYWHLMVGLGFLMPAEALKIEYDPTSSSMERQKAVSAWRKQIPAGTLPKRG